MPASKLLSLDDLKNSPKCLTVPFRLTCGEACLYTLTDLNHQSGSKFIVNGDLHKEFELVWTKTVTAEMNSTWTEQAYTTDHAAVGLSFLLIPHLSEFSVIHRSRKGHGFDYWLAPKGTTCRSDLPFDGASRLEISGIFRGKNSHIQGRVQQKLKQTNQSDSMRIPAYVIVIEFSQLTSVFIRKV